MAQHRKTQLHGLLDEPATTARIAAFNMIFKKGVTTFLAALALKIAGAPGLAMPVAAEKCCAMARCSAPGGPTTYFIRLLCIHYHQINMRWIYTRYWRHRLDPRTRTEASSPTLTCDVIGSLPTARVRWLVRWCCASGSNEGK